MALKAVAFDVDGVLTGIDNIWRHIHESLGTWSEARKNAELFYEGRISYSRWAELDVSLWRGVSLERISQIVHSIPLREGAMELSRYLKKREYRVFAISAGLDILADRVSRELGLDAAVANKLIARKGVITGDVEVLVEYDNKGEVLRSLCRQFGIEPWEVIAVGDSEVDLSMMEVAGFSIAFNPSTPKLIDVADKVVYSRSLLILIPIIEFSLPRSRDSSLSRGCPKSSYRSGHK